MKILAIRGRNLASLAAEFCVDFQAEPLASAGLYAITGPTGAGKSTLLDALCVALYDGTPRLLRAASRGESIPDVGEHSVGPADPRTLLRRGAGEGFAEVDFVGGDGLAYRARWSVRRARGRAEGRLQASELSLQRLSDGQVLSGNGKTETLALIALRIGLSFEQFTRAVLLAQNDFAAFLKATDDDRAELLQTLTGTATYAEISRQAFLRARTESEALRLIEGQLADLLPLEPEARQAMEAALAAEATRADDLRQQQAALEAQLRWQQQRDGLAAQLAEARQALARAGQARDAAEARRHALSRVEAVQPARPLCAEEMRLQGEQREAVRAVAEREARLAAVSGEVAAREESCLQAGLGLRAAEQARDTARPDLDAAREVDARIGAVMPLHEQTRRSLEAAHNAHADAENARRLRRAEHVAAAQARDAADRWLAGHQALRALAENWPRWEILLGKARTDWSEARRLAAAGTDADTLATQRGADLAAVRQALDQARQRLATAQAALDDLNRQCVTLDPPTLASRRQAHETRRDLLTRALALATDEARLVAAIATRQGEERALRQTLAEQGAVLSAGDGRLPLLLRDAQAAERALDIARLAASESVEALRRGLEADHPCPVCGALAHPYALHDPGARAMLAGLEADLARARHAEAELGRQLAAARATVAGAERQLDMLTPSLAALQEERDEVLRRRRELPILAEPAELVAQPAEASIQRLQAELLQTGQALDAVARDEASQRALLARRDAAGQAVELARGDEGRAAERVHALTLQHQEAQQAAQTLRHLRAGSDQSLQHTLGELAAAFPDDETWRDGWQADPAAFAARCGEYAHAWRRHQDERTEAGQRLAHLDTALAAAADALAAATVQLDGRREDCDGHARTLADLQAQRRGLLDGRPVSEVEAALTQAVAAAREALDATRTASQAAIADRARQDEALGQARSRLSGLEDQLSRAARGLAEWLQTFNAGAVGSPLDMPGLHAALALDSAWLNAERQALQMLETAVSNAEAVEKAKGLALEAHLAEAHEEEPAGLLAERRTRIDAELAAAGEAQTGFKLELARDDERRARSLALRADRDRQQARTALWARLGDLIGSADGKKFRNFAQQFTLDILLGYANRHLENLSRRYRLERIRESLGLLVIDQDMGDELRSVHSLSGGESFLVSLALALGLASLSSHRVRVESLFIDEGFGSLDADSLRVAMEALDSLQAQGRKVGVISHVQEMTERIATRVQLRRMAGGQSRVVVG